MNRSLLWRGIMIGAIVLGAALSAYPIRETINLGLDLQGGMHMVLEVQTQDALKAETDKEVQLLTRDLQDAGIAQPAVHQVDNTSFEITGLSAEDYAKVEKVADDKVLSNSWSWSRTGDKVLFSMDNRNVREIEELSVVQALQTIRNRVDAFGVSEPVIQRVGLGANRIVVQLPGVDDPDRVRRLIKNTAFLEFRLVDFPPPPTPGVPTREAVLANYPGSELPDSLEILGHDIKNDAGAIVGKSYYSVERQRVITGRDLKTARPGLGDFNEPVVLFTLTREGGTRFGEVTGANVGRGLAIILDGKVVSAPRLNSRITFSGQIEGGFTQQQVQDLSTVLRSGALPAGIEYLEERTVGPSLGRDSIEQGLKAGLIGLGLVLLSMLLVYKLSGVNAVVALLFNVVLIFGALAYFGATLTLPGIAGIILTIGMAVDANVLIFERIREELRVGRTVRSAIDSGFGKALSSILDANITTLIAALFLFQFGTGPIRGFAVTLSVGILGSVFSAVVVSRWLFDLLFAGNRRVEKLSI